MPTHRFHSSFDRLIALWILRILSRDLGRRSFINDSYYADSRVAEYLGLPREPDEDTLRAIPCLLDGLQKSLGEAKTALPALAQNNFKRVADSIGLNTMEQRILEFYVCFEMRSLLSDAAEVIPKFHEMDPTFFLSIVLELPRNAVAKAVASEGRLIKCGLLKEDNGLHRTKRLEIHSERFASRLLTEPYDRNKLLKAFGVIRQAAASKGTLTKSFIFSTG